MAVTLTATGDTLEGALAQLAMPDAQSPSPPAVDSFPANPGDAPYPSPDYSTIVWMATLTPPGPVGPPYLRDATGAIWTLAVDPAQSKVAAFTNGLARNVPAGGTITQLIVAGNPAQVFTHLSGGQFQIYNTNGGTTNVALPPPHAAAPAPVSMPPDPPHAAVAPGSSGNVILAGPSQTIKTLVAAVAAAKAGDTIRLDAGAVFAESVAPAVPVLIDGQGGVNGVGGAALDGSTFTAYARGKGGIVPLADCIVKGMEIRGFGMKETASGGTSGIRPDTGCGWLAIVNCNIHDNQDGVACGDLPLVVQMTDTVLSHNGLGDGFSHNIYLDVVVRLEMTRVQTSNPTLGHALKHRGHAFVATDSAFGPVENGACFDFPNGTTSLATFLRCFIEKSATSPDHHVGRYAEENQTNGLAGVRLSTCHLDLACAGPFIDMGGGTVTIDADCIKTGNHLIAQGGTVVGA